MLLARLLKPWEVLKMGIRDLRVTEAAGSQYLLVVVNRAKGSVGLPLLTSAVTSL